MTNRVLVVDDNDDLREAVCMLLSSHGYQTIEAKNGKTGLAMYNNSKPTLVITDYSMPEMTGEEMIESIRQTDATTPIVLLTGELSDEIILDLLRFTRFVAIHKPLDPKALLEAVKHVLALPIQTQISKLRKTHRINTQLPAEISGHGNVEIQNISSTGIYLLSPKSLSIGEVFKIKIPAFGDHFILAEAVWTSKPSIQYGFGARFLELSPSLENKLRKMLISEWKKQTKTRFW